MRSTQCKAKETRLVVLGVFEWVCFQRSLQPRQPVHCGCAVPIENNAARLYLLDYRLAGELSDRGIVDLPISGVSD